VRYLLDLEVDGRAYCGTQVQINGPTVQGAVATALRSLTGEDGAFRPGSRLDQGVSARSYPGTCTLSRTWEPAILGLALNQHLPNDLVVRRVAPVADDFDCLRQGCSKTYRYRLRERAVRTVLDRACWWLRDLPHPERLAPLAALIPGEHDLSGFACLRHDGTDDDDPVRRYSAAAWSEQRDGDSILRIFSIAGRGFLYKQVRGLVGAMVYCALGRANADDFRAVMAAGRGNTLRLGNIAPSEGLLLDSVEFDTPIAWQTVAVRER
jgi:tRNA pseudouridine38-40 synthase